MSDQGMMSELERVGSRVRVRTSKRTGVVVEVEQEVGDGFPRTKVLVQMDQRIDGKLVVSFDPSELELMFYCSGCQRFTRLADECMCESCWAKTEITWDYTNWEEVAARRSEKELKEMADKTLVPQKLYWTRLLHTKLQQERDAEAKKALAAYEETGKPKPAEPLPWCKCEPCFRTPSKRYVRPWWRRDRPLVEHHVLEAAIAFESLERVQKMAAMLDRDPYAFWHRADGSSMRYSMIVVFECLADHGKIPSALPSPWDED